MPEKLDADGLPDSWPQHTKDFLMFRDESGIAVLKKFGVSRDKIRRTEYWFENLDELRAILGEHTDS